MKVLIQRVKSAQVTVYRPLVDSSQFMHGDFAAGCTVEIEANLNKVSEIERCNPAVKDPCRNGKDQLEAGIDTEICGKIGRGLLIFVGIHHSDTAKEVHFLAEKVATLRIFTDAAGKMNLSVKDLSLDALVVSQFTLYANCMGGRRPDFIQAAPPSLAEPLYLEFIHSLEKKLTRPVAQGRFGAKMEVELINDGPVTLLLEQNHS